MRLWLILKLKNPSDDLIIEMVTQNYFNNKIKSCFLTTVQNNL